MKRTFSSLNPQEALHVAIFIEERNAELYHRFAEMFVEFRDVQSLEIASVFWDMAVEERHHSTLLQQRYAERYGNSACTLTDEDLQENIELPRLEDSEIFDDSSEPGKPGVRQRAFQVALKAETGARQFYAQLAENTSDFQLQKLYKELAELEEDHIAFLEKKIVDRAAQNNDPI